MIVPKSCTILKEIFFFLLRLECLSSLFCCWRAVVCEGISQEHTFCLKYGFENCLKTASKYLVLEFTKLVSFTSECRYVTQLIKNMTFACRQWSWSLSCLGHLPSVFTRHHWEAPKSSKGLAVNHSCRRYFQCASLCILKASPRFLGLLA